MINLLSLSDLSYKEIVDYVNSIEESSLKDSFTIQLIDYLKLDKRKNVNLLAKRLENKITIYQNEEYRVKSMYEFDKSFGSFKYVAGIDEVGRGPLAGPIVAAAVILDEDLKSDTDIILGLNDSKKVPLEKREKLSDIIIKKSLSYSIVAMTNDEIDKYGIGYCNNMIFINACKELSIKPDIVLTDGYPIKGYDVNNKSVIKGDAKSAAIAAASIIAKVYRDRLMREYSTKFPVYKFDKNVGYGTKEHIDAIKAHGITSIHRKSFLKDIMTY